MCGRQCVGAASIAETSRYSGKTIPGGCQENKNFCPSLESALVVKKEADSGEKELVSAKWGLMPAWMMKDLKPGAKANHGKLNNARGKLCNVNSDSYHLPHALVSYMSILMHLQLYHVYHYFV
jgi:putative SOS response-associated peptidase YedK